MQVPRREAPQRTVVVQDWAERVKSALWSSIGVPVDVRPQLGKAIEIRIGLDLADAPGYWELLLFLPAVECHALPQRVGYARDGTSRLADSGTADPLLWQWDRLLQPLVCGDDERTVRESCWRMAAMRDISYERSRSAESCRALFISMFRGRIADGPSPAVDARAHLWQGYLTHGRRQLAGQGNGPVFLGPELASRFGRPDLVIGRRLIDIKAVMEHSLRLEE